MKPLVLWRQIAHHSWKTTCPLIPWVLIPIGGRVKGADNKFSGKATVADSDKPDDLDPVERLGAADGDDRLVSVRPEAKAQKPQKLKRHVFLKIDSWLDSTLWNAGYDLAEAWEEITIFSRKFRVRGWKRVVVDVADEAMTFGTAGFVLLLALALPAWNCIRKSNRSARCWMNCARHFPCPCRPSRNAMRWCAASGRCAGGSIAMRRRCAE